MEGTPKVLIVDDDPYISEMYSLKFRESGFEIETAVTGKEALEKVASFHPDIVLLDVVMPVYDGFEVLKRIRENPETSAQKIIILSNLGQKEDITRGKELLANDYIIKAHFTPSEVVEKVRGILAG